MTGAEDSARARLDRETAALKAAIYELIKNGQTETAGQILEKYAILNPADPEISAIRRVISPDGAEAVGADETRLSEEYKLLGGIETVFILSGIIFKRSGYIDSVLRKVKMMEDMWGYRPLILTCAHKIDQRQIQTWLQTAGSGGGQVSLNKETRVLNVYDYFQKSYAENLENKAIYSAADDGARYVPISERAYDVYDGDVLIRKELFTGSACSLRLALRYKDGRRERAVYYDDWGYVNYIREYDPGNEKHYPREKYYTTDQKLCIEAFYRYEDEKNALEKLVVYDDNGGIVRECADDAELAALCLERIMSEDKFYMLVVEDGLMSKAAAAIEKKNAARAIVVHSIFLKDAYNLESDPQMFYRYLCENQARFEGIVLLTRAARNDFFKKYGNVRNTFIIPHFYPCEIVKTDFDKRDHRKAVIVARLDPFKQIDCAIDIFSIVVKKLPDARLEIYGRGPEEESLRAQIKALSLEKNVFLMGFTDDPISVFKGAALSMMTSAAEGFGLTQIESICNGCPVFAFDIKYGPSEIIDDGRTGFLFPRFNKEKYAEKIIAYFEDEGLQKAMSENAYADAPRFGVDLFMDNWYNFIETLYKRYSGAKPI